ncbi:hypothetical protein [Kitasatospora sp. NPDC050543]|uniref:hypothetical protein n=1 Tax=Kitasatospora sp. NPDC050543 TaxID=3364054 RepID=UPI0037BCBA3F
MTGNAEVTVHFARLRDLMPVYPLNLTGDEVDVVRDLYCAVSSELAARHRRDWRRSDLDASAADAERWYAASGEILGVVERMVEEERRALRALYRKPGMLPRALWNAGHAPGNRRRARYDRTMERLRHSVLTAYRDYREQAGDLTPRIQGEHERQERRMRELRAQMEEEQREREPRERAARAAAMAGAPGEPVWAYAVHERTSTLPRRFEISLQTVSEVRATGREVAQTGLTPEEVQAALTEERERDRYTVVLWSHETGLALREWHESGKETEAWQELTGVLVDPWPRITEQSRWRQRYHGPSSNYFSPGGFGTY